MGLFDKIRKKGAEVADSETERRDRMTPISATGSTARRHKPVVDAWKNMCKGMQTDWVERVSYLMEEDLKAGGVKVPTSVDQALDGSAGVISMARASEEAVVEMANKQIANIQATVASHRAYLADVEAQIDLGENRISSVRAEIAQEKVNLAHARKQYEDFQLKAATGEVEEQVPEEPPKVEPPLPGNPALIEHVEPGENIGVTTTDVNDIQRQQEDTQEIKRGKPKSYGREI